MAISPTIVVVLSVMVVAVKERSMTVVATVKLDGVLLDVVGG